MKNHPIDGVTQNITRSGVVLTATITCIVRGANSVCKVRATVTTTPSNRNARPVLPSFTRVLTEHFVDGKWQEVLGWHDVPYRPYDADDVSIVSGLRDDVIATIDFLRA